MSTLVRNICCYVLNAQSIRNVAWFENVCVRRPVFQRIDQNVKYLKTEAFDTKLIGEASTTTEEDDEVTAKKEEEIQRKRNKSRLNPQHRNLLHGKVPYPEPMDWFHETVKYKRKMYGRYGQSSGVLPGIMWPNREELEEIKEYESVAYPYTIQELVARVEDKKKEEQEALKAREEDIMKKFAKLEQWKHDVRVNAAKKLAAVEAAKAKKDRLVEEVRRHFGFKIDPRDDRFKELLEQKEKEERKKAKEAKKKARQQLVMARLKEQMQLTQETDRIESDNVAQKP